MGSSVLKCIYSRGILILSLSVWLVEDSINDFIRVVFGHPVVGRRVVVGTGSEFESSFDRKSGVNHNKLAMFVGFRKIKYN